MHGLWIHHDPENGDPNTVALPCTPFERLLDRWVYPICGADKSLFEKVE